MAEDLEREKAAAARAAVAHVARGMRIALGTGSTAAHAIRAIAERFPDGGDLEAVASSVASERLARELGLAVRPLREGDLFDLMIDGADEVAPDLSLTKGGGGALLREKLLARESRTLLIIVDHTKLVPRLGTRSPIPLEVVPFARPALQRRLVAMGFSVRLRSRPGGGSYLTDNGNELLDLHPPAPIEDPGRLDRELHGLTGMVESGLFVHLARRVFVGHPDGSVEERESSEPVRT